MLQRTNIYLPSHLLSLIKTKAKEEKITMAAKIRQILEEKISKENTNWAESLLKLSQTASKGSGRKDLSKRHDYYLYIEPYLKKQKKYNK